MAGLFRVLICYTECQIEEVECLSMRLYGKSNISWLNNVTRHLW